MVQETLLKVAEIEVSYKPNYKAFERPKIKTSAQSCAALIQMWDKEKIQFVEEFKVLLLNRANRVIGVAQITQGGVSGVQVDTKVVFTIALKACASGIILYHNHPSLELKPSREDRDLANRLVLVGELLDLKVLDHLIISQDRFYSFAVEGVL